MRRGGAPSVRRREGTESVAVTGATLIDEEKAIIRRDAMTRRNALPADLRAQAAEMIAARPFPVAVAPGSVVSGFMPLKSEINPLPLMRKLADAGARLALPVVDRRGKPLIMRAFAFGDALDAGQWGIREPKPEAPEVAPDIMLVPLLAFDRAGRRIGYGAGYYDMTIAKFRATKPVVTVGIAYAAQEIADVPVTERDARLDLVLTERETIDLRGS
jgi:5-formyltetrahydrofolate cyclo-ligase